MLTNQNFSINTTSMNFPPSEPGGGALRQKKRQAPEAKKICRVCGDKAYSVNFNVITCESCKAFFRRNALKKKEFRCQTSGNCDISIQTRRTCKKCRLRKCFEVGMVKEWIMSEEAKSRKRELIEHNRKKRQQLVDSQRKLDNSEVETITSPESCADFTIYQQNNSTTQPPAANFSPPNWQPTHSSLASPRPSSVSSQGFQHASTSAFQPFNQFSNPSPHYGITSLRPEPIAQSPALQMDEMIAVPKTFLAALINQCHVPATKCPHRDQSCQSRPSVIVANKSMHMSCICRCRCGAENSSWLSSKSEQIEEKTVTDVTADSSDSEDDDDSSEDEENLEVSSNKELVLFSGNKQNDYILNFNFGLSGANLFHLADLLAAFKYPESQVGRIHKYDSSYMPALPPILYNISPGECASRTVTMLIRLVKFCNALAKRSKLKNKVICKLFQDSCLELILLHSIMAYSLEQESWYDQGPNVRPISADQLHRLKGGVFYEHTGYVKSFPRVCKDDVVVILMLCAISFFNPERVKGNDAEQVQLMRQFYLGLLKHYLQNTFDVDKARMLSENLATHLEKCVQIASRVVPTAIIKFNERDVEPLLIEILGYK